MKHNTSRGKRLPLKEMCIAMTGSLFLQVFCWAMYSLFEMNIWLCGCSALMTAMMYHFFQKEHSLLPYGAGFVSVILLPFLAALAVTAALLIRYPQLTLLSASLDGVSTLTEMISLYAARLVVNGVVLLLYAPVDYVLFRKRNTQREQGHETKR
ncbi:MAG: hypothetical protein MJ071_04650 [Oscillospiraceae bacterium]|nr:hypothetical protein [Oscillospiraceae bacterium]